MTERATVRRAIQKCYEFFMELFYLFQVLSSYIAYESFILLIDNKKFLSATTSLLVYLTLRFLLFANGTKTHY